jgi:hypothetical protein
MLRRGPCLFTGVLESFDPKQPALEIVILTPLGFERLRGGPARLLPAPFSGQIPLDVVETVRNRTPVRPAFGRSRNSNKLPALADFNSLNDIDVKHRDLTSVPTLTVYIAVYKRG